MGQVGITFIRGEVTGRRSKKLAVDFMIDSGAQYTVLPYDVWTAIGLKPKRRDRFVLADGTAVERDISECHISLPQGEGHTPVVLGEHDDSALLGAVTLKKLGLILNPFTRTLHHARLLMM